MTRRWPAALIAGGGLAVLTLGVASGQAPAPAGTVVPALLRDFVPVTDEMLLRPEPENWISFCNGYNLWGYSSLDEIDAGNVGEMRLVWSRAMQHGYQEVEPIVYNGVMFLPNVEDIVQALDATTGDLLWEYRRALPDNVANVTGTRYRYRNVSIYVDKVFLATNDAFLVALDVRTGEVVWEMQRADYSEQVAQTTGPLVIGGKLVTGSRCNPQSPRPGGCFVTGHDLETGRELWRVNTAATSTGKTLWSHQQRAPIYGSVLATGGDLVFGGDVVRRFRAFGAETGDGLWRTILNGPVGGRPKTYSVGGRQHIAIAPAGLAIGSAFLGLTPELTTPSGSNTLFVFALPEQNENP